MSERVRVATYREPDDGLLTMTCAEICAMDCSDMAVAALESELIRRRTPELSPIAYVRRLAWDHVYSKLNPFGSISELPCHEGVYFITSCPNLDRIIYIGKAANLKHLWSRHPHIKLLTSEHHQCWWKTCDREGFGSVTREEAFYIALFAPSLNRVIHCEMEPTDGLRRPPRSQAT